METIKKYGISLLITLAFILIFTLFINIFNYFDLLSTNIYKGLVIFFIIISTFVGSFILGEKTNNNGYISGIIFGSVLVILFILISLITENSFNFTSFIYYLIVLITSFIGSVFGINKKATENNQ